MLATRNDIVVKLQAEILSMQGFKPGKHESDSSALDFMRDSFPNGCFPTGCVHEFVMNSVESIAATIGFMTGLLSRLMLNTGPVLWIGMSRKIFPPALKYYGWSPEQIIFIDVKREKDILWAMDEALKCSSLSAVIGELREISFTESRRLQLATEQSKVTGFLLRNKLNPGTTACVSRWKIKSMPSESLDDLPGIGFPKWQVELLRMRNGKPGSWNVSWKSDRFCVEHEASLSGVEANLEPEMLNQKIG